MLLAACGGGSDDNSAPASPEPAPANPSPTVPAAPADPEPTPPGIAKYVGTWEACSSAPLKTTYTFAMNDKGGLTLTQGGRFYTGPGCTGTVRAELTREPRQVAFLAQTTRTGRTYNSTVYPEINVVAAFDDVVSTGSAGWTMVGPEVYETVQFGRNWCITTVGGAQQCYLQPTGYPTNENLSIYRDGTSLYLFLRNDGNGGLSNGIPFQKVR